MNLENLKCGTLNMRSLNCSDPSGVTSFNKFEFLINENCDIWFLSEIKAHSASRVTEIINHLKFHRRKQYELILNSSNKSRGTAIMYAKHLNLKIEKISKSLDENILCCLTQYNDMKLTLACVYAPCDAQKPFFDNLNNLINECRSPHLICGGDFNCTPSALPPHLNPDLEFHPSSCNQAGSNYIAEWSTNNNFIDPFRSLWGDKKAFSFERKSPTNTARSRIDFFLISSNLLNHLSDAGYKNTPRLFDHKLCFFKLNNAKKTKNHRPTLDPGILNSEKFIRECRIETYNFINENFPNPPLQLTTNINLLNKLNYDIIILEGYLYKDYDRFLLELKNTKINEFNNKCDTIDISIQNFNYNTETPSLFLLSLLNNLRNVGHNLTCAKIKEKLSFRRYLENKLQETRESDPTNKSVINELSEKLNALCNLDAENLFHSVKMSRIDKFENDPHILSSLITKKSSTPLSVIKNENGDDFSSNTEQTNHIISFYEALYSNPIESNISCRQFLGELEPPKIPIEKCNALISDFTPHEIDNVIYNLNLSSAPGIDNFSNLFIKKVYILIKPLLLKSFNAVKNRTDKFPDELKVSYLKVIPKKSNPELIKNWRPITISSVIHKIYCKALANRITKILPDILSDSQKAYRKTHNICEASLNTIVNISASIKNEEPMFTISSDFSKAFDRLSHEYIFKALSAFGFPNEFILIIKDWLTNRKSCIKLDDGTFSKFFDIYAGSPQGDPLSGFIFIICIELLLLRIQHDPVLKPNINLFQEQPCSSNEGFADDIITFTPPNKRSLDRVIEIFNEFSKLSGLKLNKDKTFVLVSGCEPSNELIDMINESGLSYATSITHLGIFIDNKLERLDENWKLKLKKLESLRNIFLSLNPSLISKLTIVKTFFLSQLTYIGSILEPSDALVLDIENFINRFIFPNFNTFPKQRIFTTIDDGGLGIPNLKQFFFSLITKTASRAHLSKCTWALTLKNHFPFSTIELASIRAPKYLILAPLIRALNSTSKLFYDNKSRIWSSFIFQSNSFQDHEQKPIPFPHFNPVFRQIRIRDLISINERKLVSYGDFLNIMEDRIPYNIYFAIYSCYRNLRDKYEIPEELTPVSSLSFIYGKGVSAKYFRNLLLKDDITITATSSYQAFDHYYQSHFCKKQSKFFYATWSLSFLPNEIKNFTLKRINNKILLNYQLSYFNDEIHPYCTWCYRFPLTNMPLEKTYHFFYSCPTTFRLLSDYFENIFNEPIDIKQLLFKGHKSSSNDTLYLNIEITLFTYFLYKYKTLKKFPTIGSISFSIAMVKKMMLQTSTRYKAIISHIRKLKRGKCLEHLRTLDMIP